MTLKDYIYNKSGIDEPKLNINYRNFSLSAEPDKILCAKVIAIKERPFSGPLVILKARGCIATCWSVGENISDKRIGMTYFPLTSFEEQFDITKLSLGRRKKERYLGRAVFYAVDTGNASRYMPTWSNSHRYMYEQVMSNLFEYNGSIVLYNEDGTQIYNDKIKNWDDRRIFPLQGNRESITKMLEESKVAAEI